MGFIGMDTEAAGGFAQELDRAAERIDELRARIDGAIAAMDGAWRGTDADALSGCWTRSIGRVVAETASLLAARAEELQQHRQEQNQASDGQSSMYCAAVARPRLGSSLRGKQRETGLAELQGGIRNEVFGTDGWSPGEFWDELKEDAGISALDAGLAGVSAPHDAVGALAKGGLVGAPFFFPYVGDAYAGIVAGAERWEQDSSHTDLTMGDRVTRALLDGGANALGSFGGGVVLGPVGMVMGAYLGAHAGPEGAVVGGIAGEVIGDGTGSYGGATVADAAIDSLLD